MTAVAAWAALVLALLELLLLAGVIVTGRRFWRQVAPQVTPLLAMFTAPASAVNSATGSLPSVTGPASTLPPSGP